MDSLPAIPTPVPQLWREIRIRILPVITFTSVIAALVLMWRGYVMPSSIIGEAEVIQANVVAKEDGVITELAVDRFDAVTRDQVIGHVTGTDKELQQASLAVVESDLRVLDKRMELDRIRNYDNYIRLKATLLAEQELLADLQPRFVQADFEYQTQEKLFQGTSNMISLAQLKIAERDRDSYKVRIDKKREAIAAYEKIIKEVEQTGIVQVSPLDPTIAKSIEDKKNELLEITKPSNLRVPIDGRVSAIFKRAGERVRRGEAILTVNAPTTDRIIGYIRQPLNRIPTTNDTVLVRTRTQKRVMVQGQILHIGPSMVPLEPALLSPDSRRREVGLPILIGLPQDSPFQLVPGEFVDISIQYAKQ